MGFQDGLLMRAIIDGLLAERKLKGDTDVIAPYDKAGLEAIITQGKRAETRCRALNKPEIIQAAYERGKGNGNKGSSK